MEQEKAQKMVEQLNLRLERDRFGRRFVAIDVKELSDETNGFIIMLEE